MYFKQFYYSEPPLYVPLYYSEPPLYIPLGRTDDYAYVEGMQNLDPLCVRIWRKLNAFLEILLTSIVMESVETYMPIADYRALSILLKSRNTVP